MSHLSSPGALLRMIWRRLPVILLILAIGLPASVWFGLSRTRLYEATAVIQIETPQIAEQVAGQAVAVNADSQLDLIQQRLMSRDHLLGLIERFEIFPAEVPQSEQVFLLRQAVTIVKLVDPNQSWRPDVQPSGLVITVRLDDAERAAAVANDFLNSIVEEARTRSTGRANRTLEFFLAEEARVSAEISEVEALVAEFKRVNVASLPESLDSQRARLTRLVDLQIDIDQQIIALETSSERLREEERARQIALLEQQRDLLASNVAEIETALAAAPEVERRLSALNRQMEQLGTEYEVITQRRTEAAMTQLLEEQDQAERYEILETAIAPEFAITTSRKKIAAAGGAATVLLALGAAVLLELTGGTIRTAAQLEAQLGVRPVIVVPKLETRAARNRRKGGIVLLLAGLGALIWAFIKRGGTGLLQQLPFQRSRSAGLAPVTVAR